MSILNDNVLPLDVAEIAQPLAESIDRAALVEAKPPSKYPIRATLFGCCASLTAAHIVNAITRATISTHFGFWIADFRLSE
jgi:hypothetical protein